MQKLHGLRILNTRPIRQNKTLTQWIRQRGGISIECPALAIESIDWFFDIDLSQIHHVIFISANAVHYFFEKLDTLRIAWPSSLSVYAIGYSTAKALAQRDIIVQDVPSAINSESLLLLHQLQNVSDQTILLVKGEGGRHLIANTLRERGAKVLPLNVYRRTLPEKNQNLMDSLWREDAVDVIVITSAQALKQLFQLFGDEAKEWLQHKPFWVISDRLVKIGQQLGIKQIQFIKGLIYDRDSGK